MSKFSALSLVAGVLAQDCNPAIVPMNGMIDNVGMEQNDECCTLSSLFVVPLALTDATGAGLFGGPLAANKPCMACASGFLGFKDDGTACLADPDFKAAWNADPNNGNHECGCRAATEADWDEGSTQWVTWSNFMGQLTDKCETENHVPKMYPTDHTWKQGAVLGCCMGGPVDNSCADKIKKANKFPLVGNNFGPMPDAMGNGGFCLSGLVDDLGQGMKEPADGAWGYNVDFCAKALTKFIEAYDGVDMSDLEGSVNFKAMFEPNFVEEYRTANAAPAASSSYASYAVEDNSITPACFHTNGITDCSAQDSTEDNSASQTSNDGPSDTSNTGTNSGNNDNDDSASVHSALAGTAIAATAAALLI